MGIVSKLEEFDPKSDSISDYVERAQLFLEANNVHEGKYISTSLSAIGKENYALLRNLLIPSQPRDKTFDEIVAVLKKHFEPKPLIVSERFNFNRRQQAADESVADYVAELRRLTIHCEFGTFLDDALRDRFVCGLKSEAMQKKLLTEADLTFQRAIDIAQNMESAAANAKQLQSCTSAEHRAEDVNKLQLTANAKGGGNSCYRCGKPNHQPAQCCWKTAKCHYCGKIGHLLADCRQRLKEHNSKLGAPVKTVEVEELCMSIDHVEVTKKSSQPFEVDLLLEGKPLRMEVDTGACVSLVSKQTFQSLFPAQTLRPLKAQLRTYSGEVIPSLGEVDVVVTYKDQQVTLPLVVVEGSGPNLLGRNWLMSIRLDWKSVYMVHTLTL